MFAHVRTALTGQALPDSLRLLITAGAPIDGDTVRWFLTETGRKIHSFYGSSETGGITYDDTDTLNDPLHVGRPLPGVTVEIRDQPGGGDGRVFVKGDAVAASYAHGPGDALSQFVDGGFLTGDLGHIDAGGRLLLTGRVSPLVNVAGRKVDPSEVDRVIRALPGIRDARALGMSSATRGEELVAFVVRTDRSLSALDIRRRCAETLSPYKIPRRFIFVDALPVDARGKIDRRALAALAGVPD
jgi:acyl-coenzyme A synthetase/AMP-(fatty) acid ligase